MSIETDTKAACDLANACRKLIAPHRYNTVVVGTALKELLGVYLSTLQEECWQDVSAEIISGATALARRYHVMLNVRGANQ